MESNQSHTCLRSLAFVVAWFTHSVSMLPALAADGAPSRYLGPCALAASPDGTTLYVACEDAREVLWVSLPQGEVLKRVSVPHRPTGLVCTPEGAQLIVTCAAPKSVVAILDAHSGEIIRTITAGHSACGPAWDQRRARLYVCNRFHNDVSVIDLSTGTELTRTRGGTGTDRRGRVSQWQHTAGGESPPRLAHGPGLSRYGVGRGDSHRYAYASGDRDPVVTRRQQCAGAVYHARTAPMRWSLISSRISPTFRFASTWVGSTSTWSA